MPQVFNPAGSLTGINPNLASLRYWLWPSVTDRTAETTATAAHFVQFEGYDRRNATGNLIAPLDQIDTWPRACMDVFQATTIEELLRSAFPPPTAD